MPEPLSGRLSRELHPKRYRIQIEVEPQSRAFSGRVDIELQSDVALKSFSLHALDLQIEAVELDGMTPSVVELNQASEMLDLSFPRQVSPGHHRLSLVFSGRLNAQMRGLYEARSEESVFAFTQFEATDARRMFPCFDEPGMKAVFDLSVTFPADLTALSNMPVLEEKLEGMLKTLRFGETPVMSTYLLALAVARLEKKEALVGETKVAVWTLPGDLDLADFALKVTSAVLPRLNDYFGLPYPLPKMDLVSVPDFAMGAMENWGAIFFRDSRLLLDESLASTETQRAVASVITHEIVHQWFGNLVTMDWWDDLWLNESFATWLACKIVDQWRPEWQGWLAFQQEKEIPLAIDALRNTRPIHSEVSHAAEIEEMFDALTYEKGAACLRMIEQFLGEDCFREGIRSYMRRYQYRNARAADLWRELEAASAQPVSAMARDWFTRAGFPIITLSLEEVEGRRLRISQERFRALKDKDTKEEAAWSVPCTLRYQDEEGQHSHRILLKQAQITHTLPGKGPLQWLYGKGEELGFFRTHHDGILLERLENAGLSLLTDAEKIGLLNDLWALSQRGDLPIASFMSVLSRFKGDATRVVLEALCAYLETLSKQLIEPGDRPRFSAVVSDLLSPLWKTYGWDPAPGENDEGRLSRAALLWTLGAVAQDEDILSELPRRQSRYHVRPNSVDPSLVTPLIRLCARSDGGSRFEQYLSYFEKSKTPESRDRYLLALSDFGKPALARAVLNYALSEKVRSQDVWKPVRSLLANPAVQGPAWVFVQEHWPDLREKGGSIGAQRMIQGCRHLWREAWYQEVKSFFSDPQRRPPSAKRAFFQTLEFIQIGIHFKRKQAPGLSLWLKENSPESA